MPESSPGTPDLDKKLLEVMRAVESVPKNGRNEFHKYDYATIADVLRAVRGKLAEQGVIILTNVREGKRNGEITEVFTTHSIIDTVTGQTREVQGYGQGYDKTDKGAYKARSGDRKYLILETFLIPTGDDPEKDDPQLPRNGKPSKNGTPESTSQQRARSKLSSQNWASISTLMCSTKWARHGL